MCFFLSCSNEPEITPEKLPTDTNSLKSLLDKDINPETRLEVYYRLYKAFRDSDLAQAAYYVNQQQDLAKEVVNKMYLGRAYHAQGMLQRRSGEYIEATNSYLQAIDIFEEVGYNSGVAADINNVGKLYQTIEGYKDAIPYFEKAAQIYEESGDFKNQSIAYTNLAICNSKTGRYAEAKENIKLAIAQQLQFDSNDANRLAHVYNEAGNIYYHANQYDQAIEYYNEALAFNPSHEQMLVILYDNLANTYLTKGNYDKATKFLLKGTGITIDTKTAVERYNIEGTLYQLQGNHQKAVEVFNEAIALANKDIINEPLNNTLDLLSQSYRALTDNGAKVAYDDIYRIADLKKQQQELKDSFYDGMNAKALQAALNQEVEAHNNRKLQASMVDRQWLIAQGAGAIVAGLLIVIMVVTINTKATKKKAYDARKLCAVLQEEKDALAKENKDHKELLAEIHRMASELDTYNNKNKDA
ncbi:hypothetical protein GCM10009122_15950 [Fulvivirga kasyanovii]|nr:tetratricopeptide repeat protein [Fulvivirga kasyanovii]